MDITTEAEKLHKGLCDIDSLLSTSDVETAKNLQRLRRFFTSALDQVLDSCCSEWFLRR